MFTTHLQDATTRGVVVILDLGERFWKRGKAGRAGGGCGRGSPPWGSGGITPGKILKF